MKGEVVERYRRMIGLNQTVVAQKSNMALSSYCNKIKGNTNFNQTEMVAITKLFKEFIPQITMDDIFFKDEVNYGLTEKINH